MKKNVKILILMCCLSFSAFSQWTPIANLPGVATDGCFAVSVNGKGYVGGGNGRKSLYEYNPAANVWTKKADIPGPSQRAWSGSFVAGNKIYIIGGDSTFGGLLKDMWMYDPALDTWTRKADFPGGVRDGMFCWSFSVNLKNKVYVGGGFDGKVILNDFYAYEPITDTWETLPGNIPAAMLFASTFVLDNKGYVTFWEGGGFYRALWEFDPALGLWTERAPCPGEARGEGIGFTMYGKGYAGLGQTDFKKGYRDIYAYDPGIDQWSEFSDTLPDFRTGWSCAFVIDETLYTGTGASLPDFKFSNKFYKRQFKSSISKVDLAQQLFVYPQPANESIHLQTSREILNAKMIDMKGQCIIDVLIGEDKVLDLKGMPAGFYTLLLFCQGEVVTRKICIQR